MNTVKILEDVIEVRVMSEHVSFMTTIDDIIGDNFFSILGPLKEEQRRSIRTGEKLRLTCITERGLYIFEAAITRIYQRNQVLVYELRVKGEIRRIQRREAFRARESVEVSVRKIYTEEDMAGKWVNTHTIDISETGMLIKFNEECAAGQLLETVIRVKKYGLNEVLPCICAKAVRCAPNGNKQFGYFLGLSFTEVPERAKNILLKLVVLSQRNKVVYNPKRMNKL